MSIGYQIPDSEFAFDEHIEAMRREMLKPIDPLDDFMTAANYKRVDGITLADAAAAVVRESR